MAKRVRDLLAVSISGKNYAYYANKAYYADLKGITGITEGKDSTDYESEFPLKSFLRSGKIRYIKVATADGKNYRLLCVGDNVATALGNIRKKKVNSSQVNTAWIPGHTYLH